MKIVILGAPGSGKGTHAKFLAEHYHIPHISTGDIFREAMDKKNTLGILAKSYIDHGNLVPDDVTIALVNDRINQEDCKNGFLLDGFPRTVEQGIALNKITKLDLVLYFNIEFDVALKRLLNRRVCKNCGAIYNLLEYKSDRCEKCGSELTIRDDDKEEVITKRFGVYQKQTFPLVEFYKNLNLLKELDVDNTVEQNRQIIRRVVGDLNGQCKN